MSVEWVAPWQKTGRGQFVMREGPLVTSLNVVLGQMEKSSFILSPPACQAHVRLRSVLCLSLLLQQQVLLHLGVQL